MAEPSARWRMQGHIAEQMYGNKQKTFRLHSLTPGAIEFTEWPRALQGFCTLFEEPVRLRVWMTCPATRAAVSGMRHPGLV